MMKKKLFYLSRGEHYNAKIICEYMNNQDIKTKLMLPEDFGFILDNNYTDGKIIDKTYENIRNSFDINSDITYLVPGFYGISNDKKLLF